MKNLLLVLTSLSFLAACNQSATGTLKSSKGGGGEGIDLTGSTMSVVVDRVPADGVSVNVVKVLFKDKAGNPLPAIEPTMTATGVAEVTSCSQSNAEGVSLCMIKSRTQGTYGFKVEVDEDLKALLPDVTEGNVAFTAGSTSNSGAVTSSSTRLDGIDATNTKRMVGIVNYGDVLLK